MICLLLRRNVKFKFLLAKIHLLNWSNNFMRLWITIFFFLKYRTRNSKKYWAKMIATKCDFFTFACKKKERNDLLQNVLHRFGSVFILLSTAEVIKSSSWKLYAWRQFSRLLCLNSKDEQSLYDFAKDLEWNGFITSSFWKELAELAIGSWVKPLTIEYKNLR